MKVRDDEHSNIKFLRHSNCSRSVLFSALYVEYIIIYFYNKSVIYYYSYVDVTL